MKPAAFICRGLAVGAAALFMSGFSHAQYDTQQPLTLSQISARNVEAKYGQRSSTWRIGGTVAAGSTAGSVLVTQALKGPSPLVGQIIDVDVKRTLPWANISRAVARSLPLISTAVAIAEIAEAIRCRESAGGGAECDPGTDELNQTFTVYCLTYGGSTHCNQNRVTTAEGYIAYANANKAGNVSNIYRSGPAANSLSFYAVIVYAGGGETWNQVFLQQQTQTQTGCPQVSTPQGLITVFRGVDGKCPTLVYSPHTEDQVAERAEDFGDKARAVPIANDLLGNGVPIEHPPAVADPVPDSIIGERERTDHPDGSTTVRDTRYELAPTPNGYGWTPSVTTKDYPPGAVIPPPGEVSDGTTTTGTAPNEDPITCGLPNTPPCKIDESGTPSSATIDRAEVDQARGDALGKVADIGAIQAPAWSWSFSLPSSCSPLSVGPFAGRTVVVDLCEYQPMIHDIVALIWAAFTVWACVGMVGRAFSTG